MAKKEKAPSVKWFHYTPGVWTLDELYDTYDTAQTAAKEAEKDKADASTAIKTLLGATEEASTPRYIVTYRYDKDKDVETFDEEKFAENDTKGYLKYQQMLVDIKAICKKYTKITTVPGTRKLIVTAKEE